MVIYEIDTKELVIPNGLGTNGGDCSEAIAEAYQAGFAAGVASCQNEEEE